MEIEANNLDEIAGYRYQITEEDEKLQDHQELVEDLTQLGKS